jgi:Phage tail baseplate hub (GPD)
VAEVVPRTNGLFRSSRILLFAVLVATVSFVGSLTAAVAPATAAKLPISNVTCDESGGLSFSPPLTPAGTPGHHEKITFTETLTGCGGSPGTNVPSSPQSVKTKPIKLPAATVGNEKVVGDCQLLGTQLSLASLKQKISWSTQYRETTFDFVSRLMEEEGIYYFFNHDNGKHTLVTLGLTSASSQSLANCIEGTGGPIVSVAFDRTISSMTEGGAVLTTGGVGGTRAAVGDLLSSDVVGGPNCTSANGQAGVQSNPAAPGTATLVLTSLTFGNCTIDMGPGVGALPATVLVNDLPLSMSIGDGSGDPAALGTVSLTISVNGGAASCSYASPASPTGIYDNGTSSVDFSGSVLAFTGGTGSLAANCPSSPMSAPSFISVVDSSQSGSPAVFVN